MCHMFCMTLQELRSNQAFYVLDLFVNICFIHHAQVLIYFTESMLLYPIQQNFLSYKSLLFLLF